MELAKHTTQTTLSSQIEEAVTQGKPLHSAPEADIRTCLLYGIKLMGLPEEKYPDKKKHERDLIIVNLRKKFPSIKVEELRLAFEMYANGDLQNTEDLYGRKFNYVFVSKIIRAYRDKFRNEVITEMNKRMNAPKELNEVEKKAVQREFIEKCILPPLTEFKGGKSLDFGLVDINRVYKIFSDRELIKAGKQQRLNLGKKHTSELRAEWANKLEQKALTKDEHNFHKKIAEALKDEQTGDFAKEVIRRCKLELITEYLKITELETIINQLKK